ncbi:hypothetical protein FQV39_15195 [Bosea sp. F3-2]|uniref:hypothetical protein n=1 Tax=Bosea sp. F3-2 TaxID=2599640 RepID=UPI0011EC41AF|nr:hypothetical protein [Bosea sp. F3-2]QEL23779.1 hypothetical protein FQV39_15195 [Bosea sp. F3-2]
MRDRANRLYGVDQQLMCQTIDCAADQRRWRGPTMSGMPRGRGSPPVATRDLKTVETTAKRATVALLTRAVAINATSKPCDHISQRVSAPLANAARKKTISITRAFAARYQQ